MDLKGIVCKDRSDPTLAVGDYLMDRGTPRKVVHITRHEGGGSTVILDPVICPKERLEREQAAACHAAIMEYIMAVRSGAATPTEAGEAYLFEHLPDKYLGNGRFAGMND